MYVASLVSTFGSGQVEVWHLVILLSIINSTVMSVAYLVSTYESRQVEFWLLVVLLEIIFT